MNDTRSSGHTYRAALSAAFLFISSCGVAASAQSPSLGETMGDYGVLASPPLPNEAPDVHFDQAASIANVDATVLVELSSGDLLFRSGSDGEILASTAVSEEAELRAVAGNGTKAALFEQIIDRNAAMVSRLTIVERTEPDGPLEVRFIDLPGIVEPEAFSTDGERLFVIDHQVGERPGSYRVRPLDLATGVLETIVGPSKVPFTEDMNGTGRRQIWSPDGTRLYTLYIRQTHHHHDDGSDHSHGQPGTDGFVHVLDLAEEWAFCLDLPSAFGAGDLSTTALGVSPDGNTIAVADLKAGEIAFASTTDLAVTRVADLPKIEPVGEMFLALTANEIVLGWGTEAHWFDRTTLRSLGEGDSFNGELSGFTSNGQTVHAWTANGPVPLMRP